MRRAKLAIGIIAAAAASLAVFFALSGANALITHPRGLIARGELRVIITDLVILASAAAPVYFLLFATAWRYRAGNRKAGYEPERRRNLLLDVAIWAVPAAVLVSLAVLNWRAAHELDPFRPIDGEARPLTIQVVALDWKWLFIYPEQGIAAVNFVEIPERTPIVFELAADGAPMNSFWIPQLSGQMYSMTGMSTELHLMADGPGDYAGRAAEINGPGFADMTFAVRSASAAEFESWVAGVKRSSDRLTDASYGELVKPSAAVPVILYSSVPPGLYENVVAKYSAPAGGPPAASAMPGLSQ